MMARAESKIFDEYVKWAETEGLVSEADYAEGRIGSDTEEVIQLLYGVKPNGKEDDTHIIDKAHPDTAVIVPAHDAMNSIVENDKQRQDIMTYVALKHPTGNHTMHRYVRAHGDLVNSLVRVGFALDNEEQETLMKLADSCSQRLVVKNALGPAALIALPWIAKGLAFLGVAGLGYLAIANKTRYVVQSVHANAEGAIREIQDISDREPNVANEMISQLRELQTASKSAEQAASTLSLATIQLKDAEDVLNLMVNGEYKDEVEIIKKYTELLTKWHVKINQFISVINRWTPEEYEADWWTKLKGLVTTIVGSDTEEAINALTGLGKAIEEAIKQNHETLNSAGKYKEQFDSAAKKVSEKTDVSNEQELADLQKTILNFAG